MSARIRRASGGLALRLSKCRLAVKRTGAESSGNNLTPAVWEAAEEAAALVAAEAVSKPQA